MIAPSYMWLLYIWDVASMTEKLDFKLLASFDVSLYYQGKAQEVVFVIALLSKILRTSFLKGSFS